VKATFSAACGLASALIASGCTFDSSQLRALGPDGGLGGATAGAGGQGGTGASVGGAVGNGGASVAGAGGGGAGGTGGQAATTTSMAPGTCVPDASVACACPTGQQGAQTCTSAGMFAACVCAAPTADAGRADGSDGATPPDAPSATGGSGGLTGTGGAGGIGATTGAGGIGGVGGTTSGGTSGGGSTGVDGSGGSGDAGVPDATGAQQDVPIGGTGGVSGTGGSMGVGTGGSSGAGGGPGAGGTTNVGGTMTGGSATGGTSTGGTGGSNSSNGGAGGQGATGGQGGATGGTGGSTTTAACSGVLRAGICWYLGPQGSSCQQACASHGQPASGAASHVGTAAQGGSLAECGVILGLLGITGTPSTTFGLEGLGCFMRSNGSLYWVSLANFSATASAANASLVCGCTK
jgi:hypothetical protein